jgi:hypothetical protein
MIGGFVAASGGRGPSTASLVEAVAEEAIGAHEARGDRATGPGTDTGGAMTGAGSLRIELGTSGRGVSSATSA